MENKEGDKKKTNYEIFKPALIFYAKTTSWIILPLIVAVLIGKYFTPSLSLVIMVVAFGVTCFGIYREIKEYKKDLKKDEKKEEPEKEEEIKFHI